MEQRLSEMFNQQRMNRCLKVQRLVMDHWRKTNAFEFRIVSAESIAGKSLDELKMVYFSVGVGDQLTDLPLIDTLVVIQLIAGESRKLKQSKGQDNFTVKITVKTELSEDEVSALLQQFEIEIDPSRTP